MIESITPAPVLKQAYAVISNFYCGHTSGRYFHEVDHWRGRGEFLDAFADRFSERRSEITELLPSAAEVTGNKWNKVIATYDIEAESHEDFFDAYVMALKTAFAELVVENERLISVIDGIYLESIEQVYGLSGHPDNG